MIRTLMRGPKPRRYCTSYSIHHTSYSITQHTAYLFLVLHATEWCFLVLFLIHFYLQSCSQYTYTYIYIYIYIYTYTYTYTYTKTIQVLQKSEQQGRNEHVIDFDERNPFNLDCAALKPIYKGSALAQCSYCTASYAPEYKGQFCCICNICSVGVNTVGLVTQSNTRK